MTIQNFDQHGSADYRNPNLAAAMRILGLAQEFGVGMVLASAALAAAGYPPMEWDVGSHWVRATVCNLLRAGHLRHRLVAANLAARIEILATVAKIHRLGPRHRGRRPRPRERRGPGCDADAGAPGDAPAGGAHR